MFNNSDDNKPGELSDVCTRPEEYIPQTQQKEPPS